MKKITNSFRATVINKQPKLALRREVVAELANAQLRTVAGGDAFVSVHGVESGSRLHVGDRQADPVVI